MELGFHYRSELDHVATAYVAFVGARMHGDAVSAELLALDGEAHYIGHVLAACVAQRSYFVDIHT